MPGSQLIILFSHVCVAKSYRIGKIRNKLPYIYENYLIKMLKNMLLQKKFDFVLFSFSCESTGSRHAGSTNDRVLSEFMLHRTVLIMNFSVFITWAIL